MKMSEQNTISQIMNEAKQLRLNNKTSCLELENYLYYQYSVITKRRSSVSLPCFRAQIQVGKQFKKAFKTLDKLQQAQYYLLCVKNIAKFNENKKQNILGSSSFNTRINAEIIDNGTFKKLTKVPLQVNYENKTINSSSGIKNSINLHHFLLRRSRNKKSNGICLQSTDPSTYSQTIKIFFNENQFQWNYRFLKKIWQQAQYDNIKQMLIKHQNFPIRVSGRECLQQMRKSKQTINDVRTTFDTEKGLQTSTKKLRIDGSEQFTSPFPSSRYSSKFRYQTQISRVRRQNSFMTDDFQNQYLSEINEGQNECQFYSIAGSLEDTYLDIKLPYSKKKYVQQVQSIKLQNPNPQQDNLKATNNKMTNDKQNYLKHIHILKPKPKQKPQYKVEPEGHVVLGKRWELNKQGQLICLQKDKIKAQDNTIKFVLKRIGKQIFSGKGFPHISLPIQIFSEESQVQRLARVLVHAPHFLEKAAYINDPVERLKLVICFNISLNLNTFCMVKSFNPVVGETYQGMIDGCPVYAQQISHHPPISSVLMIGRNYRIYGNLEPKLQMSINIASGINQQPIFVEFQSDKAIIESYKPIFEMHGMLVGARRFLLTHSANCFDTKNRIFCQILYGKQKNETRPMSKMHDYFCGKIVKIRQGVDMRTLKQVKKTDIQCQYGQIYGRNTTAVYFNNQVIFDISKVLPYKYQDYTPCMPSDSRLRKDIILKCKNDLQGAQDAKQQIQLAQREDKKLRDKHNKHHH